MADPEALYNRLYTAHQPLEQLRTALVYATLGCNGLTTIGYIVIPDPAARLVIFRVWMASNAVLFLGGKQYLHRHRLEMLVVFAVLLFLFSHMLGSVLDLCGAVMLCVLLAGIFPELRADFVHSLRT